MTSLRIQVGSTLRRAALVASTALTLSNSALAIPIAYQVTGTGSGSIGATTFDNSNFVLVGLSDTTSSERLPNPFSVVYANPLQSLQITIAGIGTSNAIDKFDFFVNQSQLGAGFNNNSAADVIYFTSPLFAGYSGTDYFLPAPVSTLFTASFSTTSGALSFNSLTSLAFTAREVSAVPEPGRSLMLALGIALLLSMRLWKEREGA